MEEEDEAIEEILEVAAEVLVVGGVHLGHGREAENEEEVPRIHGVLVDLKVRRTRQKVPATTRVVTVVPDRDQEQSLLAVLDPRHTRRTEGEIRRGKSRRPNNMANFINRF